MEYEKICISCMHEKGAAFEICPVCGFDPNSYRYPSYALPPFTILNGRYLVGKVLGNGGFGITYIAYDLVLECTRSIKEFFMSGSMYRNTAESADVSAFFNSPSPEWENTYMISEKTPVGGVIHFGKYPQKRIRMRKHSIGSL